KIPHENGGDETDDQAGERRLPGGTTQDAQRHQHRRDGQRRRCEREDEVAVYRHQSLIEHYSSLPELPEKCPCGVSFEQWAHFVQRASAKGCRADTSASPANQLTNRDSWRRPNRNLLRRTAKSVIQGHPRSRPFAEASAVATRRCRRNCGGVYSNEGAEVLSYAARKHAAANSYTESAPAPAASRGQAGSRGHKTPVFLVTQDESLWPQIGPSLDRDWALKQVDTIDELLKVTRAGQPGIIVWDAREPADREGDLSRVQLHCSRFAVVVLDADTGTERWKQATQQRQIAALVGIPFDAGQ